MTCRQSNGMNEVSERTGTLPRGKKGPLNRDSFSYNYVPSLPDALHFE